MTNFIYKELEDKIFLIPICLHATSCLCHFRSLINKSADCAFICYPLLSSMFFIKKCYIKCYSMFYRFGMKFLIYIFHQLQQILVQDVDVVRP